MILTQTDFRELIINSLHSPQHNILLTLYAGKNENTVKINETINVTEVPVLSITPNLFNDNTGEQK